MDELRPELWSCAVQWVDCSGWEHGCLPSGPTAMLSRWSRLLEPKTEHRVGKTWEPSTCLEKVPSSWLNLLATMLQSETFPPDSPSFLSPLTGV